MSSQAPSASIGGVAAGTSGVGAGAASAVSALSTNTLIIIVVVIIALVIALVIYVRKGSSDAKRLVLRLFAKNSH